MTTLLEKRAFIDYYTIRLGKYMAKVATLALPPAPGLFSRMGTAAKGIGTGIINTASNALHHPSAEHLTEIGGLGVLAAPSVADLAGSPMDRHTSHMYELGGLGVLAAPSAIHAFNSFKKAPKLARV